MKNKIPIKRRQDIIFYHQNKKRHCEICHGKDRLTVHHKIPKELGGLDNIENLMTLCYKCHEWIHKDKNLNSRKRLNLLRKNNGISRI